MNKKCIYFCSNCFSVYSGTTGRNNRCPECGSQLYNINYRLEDWHNLDDIKKEQLKNKWCNEIVKRNKDMNSIIVTTGDLKQDYEIIGPVYFQLSNKGMDGGTIETYKQKYMKQIHEMENNGMFSEKHEDWGFLYGEWSVGQEDFDNAFYIAVQELKERAYILHADAIISMRQDMNLDTNGIGYFYLQMYGTAVKYK